MSEDREKRKPIADRRGALLLLAAAGALFALALYVPHLPGRDPSSALANQFGLDPEQRGRPTLDLRIERGDESLPQGAGTPLLPGDRLAFNYTGGGYLYLRIVEVRPGGEIAAILPSGAGAADVFGLRVEPHGGVATTSSIAPAAEPLILYALFSPIPVRLEKVQAAARDAVVAGPDALSVARAIRMAGVGFVRVVPRSSNQGL